MSDEHARMTSDDYLRVAIEKGGRAEYEFEHGPGSWDVADPKETPLYVTTAEAVIAAATPDLIQHLITHAEEERARILSHDDPPTLSEGFDDGWERCIDLMRDLIHEGDDQ